MEKEFVPYKESLELKELGFDEPCIRGWDNMLYIHYHPDSDIVLDNPTFSQAFRWFREKYNLTWEHSFDDSQILLYVGEITYPDNALEFFKSVDVEYDNYNAAFEKAEIECLKELIKIVKKK